MEVKRKRFVLIGTLGHGKTTLFNRLTGAQEKAKQGGESLTRIIAQGYSLAKTNEKSFEVLDTPGFGDTKEKMQHIAGILAALKQTDIHRIVIVIRHERIEEMVKNIRPVYKFIKNFKENITIYISWFDFFQGDVKKEKKLIQDSIENEFKIKSFIYFEKQSIECMIQQFDLILQKSYPLKVSFSLDEIIECFDVFDVADSESVKIGCQSGYLITQFHTRVIQPIKKFIENFPKKIDDPLYLNYLDVLEDFAKQKAEEYLQNMTKQHGDQMNNKFSFDSDNSQYASYIKLQDTLNIDLKQIKQKINEKKLIHPDFIGSKIKACPHCGLLWVSDYGCNRILCGDSAGKYNPTLKLKPLVKFEYKIENNQVKLIENNIQLFKNENELIYELKNSFNNGQFKQILKQINIKHDYELIELLQKELGKSCFNQWIQMIDKKNYNEFVQTLVELLLESSQKPKEGTKVEKGSGCGQYFLWEYEFRSIIYYKAKPLTKQQIQELNDQELFKMSKLENNQEQEKLKKWLDEQEKKLNEEIDQQLKKIKVVPQILQKKQSDCRIF